MVVTRMVAACTAKYAEESRGSVWHHASSLALAPRPELAAHLVRVGMGARRLSRVRCVPGARGAGIVAWALWRLGARVWARRV